VDTLGIAIVGCGFIGQTHAWTIQRHVPEARVVAVSGGRRAPKLAADLGVPCTADLAQLLAQPQVQAVIVATPDATHAPITLQVLAAGKHVLVEKPMATTLRDCDAMIGTARSAGRVLMLAHTQRFRDGNLKAHEMIRGGAIGRVLAVEETQHLGSAPELAGWSQTGENRGTLLSGGVHNLDRLRWLTGVEVATVSAQCRNDRAGG